MAIKSSQFYKKLEQLENARLTGIENLRAKGLNVSELASIPNITDKIKDVPSSSLQITKLESTGNRIIYAADLANNYLYLLKDNNILDIKKTPDVTGGIVAFTVEEDGDYDVASSTSDSDIPVVNKQFECEITGTGKTYSWIDRRTLSIASRATYNLFKFKFNVPKDGCSASFDFMLSGHTAGYGLIFSNVDTE